MPATPQNQPALADAIFKLGEIGWRLGSILSRLRLDSDAISIVAQTLIQEVKSLRDQCDLVHAKVKRLSNETVACTPQPVEPISRRILASLRLQTQEINQTFRQLELLIDVIDQGESKPTVQFRWQKKLDKSQGQITSITNRFVDHTDHLRLTLLLINTISQISDTHQVDYTLTQKLSRLRDLLERLQPSSGASSEATSILIDCAREVVEKSIVMYESRLTSNYVSQQATHNVTGVAEWVDFQDDNSHAEKHSAASYLNSNVSSTLSWKDPEKLSPSNTSETQGATSEGATGDDNEESDDDLDADLARAAIETGTRCFEAEEWIEATSLFQEATRLIQQLSSKQLALFDVFDLRYRLAACAYYTQEPASVEEVLLSISQHRVRNDEQRVRVCDATHLLALVYLRTDCIDRARSECEKALQTRRRLLGKQSTASLESMALMAHICFLLDNRARGKSCLATIPEVCRATIVKNVEKSLGARIDRPIPFPADDQIEQCKASSSIVRVQSTQSASTAGLTMASSYSSPSLPDMSQFPPMNSQYAHRRISSFQTDPEGLESAIVASPTLHKENKETSHMFPVTVAPVSIQKKPANTEYTIPTPAIPGPVKGNLSRKEILERVGCQPKDNIEEAVCNGDHSAFARCLSKKKDSWRSKFRKNARSERVTALHFAALFGEVDMARQLLAADYNVNEVPYGYSTELTPIKFAIGARQVGMVELFLAYGAKPTMSDSWSTLAGQLLNRSWLAKTMCESEREVVPTRIIAIMSLLFKYGWDINAPLDSSGRTLLHQAVTFWTGSYKWDMELRDAIATFLCESGADPSRKNAECKTPYDLAMASGHDNLLRILRGEKKTQPLMDDWRMAPVELAG